MLLAPTRLTGSALSASGPAHAGGATHPGTRRRCLQRLTCPPSDALASVVRWRNARRGRFARPRCSPLSPPSCSSRVSHRQLVGANLHQVREKPAAPVGDVCGVENADGRNAPLVFRVENSANVLERGLRLAGVRHGHSRATRAVSSWRRVVVGSLSVCSQARQQSSARACAALPGGHHARRSFAHSCWSASEGRQPGPNSLTPALPSCRAAACGRQPACVPGRAPAMRGSGGLWIPASWPRGRFRLSSTRQAG